MTLTSTTLYSSSKDGELLPSQTKSLYGDVSQYKYLVVNAGGGLDQRIDLTIYTADLDSTHSYSLIFINTVSGDEYIIYSSLRFPTNSSAKLDTAVRYNFYTNGFVRLDNQGINVHTIIGYKY